MSDQRPIPPLVDPRDLEERGVTIPVPTPTGVNIPNPWNPPASNGGPQEDGTANSGDDGAERS